MLRRLVPTLLALLTAAAPAPAAVTLVRDINTTPLIVGSAPREFVSVGAHVFFVATTPAAGVGLWRSDGTAAGTVLLRGFGAVRAHGLDEDAPAGRGHHARRHLRHG